jgi:hypothetical protein
MTTAEQIAMVAMMTDNRRTADDMIAYLDIAGEKIIRRAYPFRDDVQEVPAKYQHLQCEIAAFLINKHGADNELIHVENGIHRHYDSGDIPLELIGRIIPYGGTFFDEE